MILGIGSDLIDIRRIEKTIARFGDRFLDRVFTDVERAALRSPRQPRGQLRQALRREGGLLPRRSAPASARGVFWRDIGVVNLPGGRPTLALTGGALERLQALTPPGMAARIDLTLTDEPPHRPGDRHHQRRA